MPAFSVAQQLQDMEMGSADRLPPQEGAWEAQEQALRLELERYYFEQQEREYNEALSSYYLLRRQHQQQAQRLNQILYGHGCAAGSVPQPSSWQLQQQQQRYQQAQPPVPHQQQLVQQRQPLQSLQPGGVMAWEAAAPTPDGSARAVAAVAMQQQQRPCRKRSADGWLDPADVQERGKRRVPC